MQVRILRPTLSASQSGDGSGKWVMEFIEPNKGKYREQVMGWYASNCTLNQVKMEFNTEEEAINFADKKNYDYEVVKPKERKFIKKSYAANFK